MDIFLRVAVIGGLGLFSLIHSARIIKQMIATNSNKTQEDIDRLAKLAPMKHGERKPINGEYFIATEAYLCAGITLFISIGIFIGCMGALISSFS